MKTLDKQSMVEFGIWFAGIFAAEQMILGEVFSWNMHLAAWFVLAFAIEVVLVMGNWVLFIFKLRTSVVMVLVIVLGMVGGVIKEFSDLGTTGFDPVDLWNDLLGISAYIISSVGIHSVIFGAFTFTSLASRRVRRLISDIVADFRSVIFAFVGRGSSEVSFVAGTEMRGGYWPDINTM